MVAGARFSFWREAWIVDNAAIMHAVDISCKERPAGSGKMQHLPVEFTPMGSSQLLLKRPGKLAACGYGRVYSGGFSQFYWALGCELWGDWEASAVGGDGSAPAGCLRLRRLGSAAWWSTCVTWSPHVSRSRHIGYVSETVLAEHASRLAGLMVFFRIAGMFCLKGGPPI